jgi:hypothetical protein
MARHSTPTPSRGYVAGSPDMVVGAARGWTGLGQFLADRWGGEPPSHVVRLLVSTREAEDHSLAVRIRAAAAADMLFR